MDCINVCLYIAESMRDLIESPDVLFYGTMETRRLECVHCTSWILEYIP